MFHVYTGGGAHEAPVSGQEYLQRLITIKTRRLQKLKEQAALTGPNTDPAILLQIEDLEIEIGDLQQQLAHLPPGDEPGGAQELA